MTRFDKFPAEIRDALNTSATEFSVYQVEQALLRFPVSSVVAQILRRDHEITVAYDRERGL